MTTKEELAAAMDMLEASEEDMSDEVYWSRLQDITGLDIEYILGMMGDDLPYFLAYWDQDEQ